MEDTFLCLPCALLFCVKRNMDVYSQITASLADKGHNQTFNQVWMKVKELWQAYHKAREQSRYSGATPNTCHNLEQLDAILGGEVSHPPIIVDSGQDKPCVSLQEGGVANDEEVEEKEEASQVTMPANQDLLFTLEPILTSQDVS